MAADDTPFLSRWSRRKVQVREGVPVAEAAPQPPAVDAVDAPAPWPAATAVQEPAIETKPEPKPAEALPTLADVAVLNRDSDYTRFVAQGVTPEVKNAALKKLFANPHFNVMDGLDTYVDDYSKPDPLPAGMLRQMVQSKLLGLFDDEEQDKPPPAATPALNAADEDLALQLQPDPAAGRAGLAPGAGQDPGRQH